jgi:choline dehydrogenase-like flavoprotein
MNAERQFDVIIVGSGAGGGTLARRLAPSGKRILILERGPFLPRERENFDHTEVWIKNRYVANDIWYDSKDRPFRPDIYYYVGGATKVYGVALIRLRKEDFGVLHHHGGESPAWPISYEDLEPYYTEAEQMYMVHGQRGWDPTEPPASGDYPFPPVSHAPRVAELAEELRQLKLRPFPMPLGVMLDEQNPTESRCIRCEICSSYPCLVQAKCDAEIIGVRPALRYPNVTLLTEHEVVRLETSPSGREVSRVIARHRGQLEAFQGDIVVLAAGAANTARILLLSANDKHPKGLANGSDQVGRNYMYHNIAVLVAFSIRRNTSRFQKTLGINDFYFGMPGFGYPMGNIQLLDKTNWQVLRGKGAPWVPKSLLKLAADHALEFALFSEDLPDPNNRVTLTRDGRIKLTYRPNNLEAMRRLQAKLKALLNEIALKRGILHYNLFAVQRIPLSAVGHQLGTCRFGTDPKTSVLDPTCKAHEVDNLYVADTSFFPSSGAVNPSLTAMANALRVGDIILERLG